MYKFNVVLFPRPAAAAFGPEIELRGVRLPTLNVDPAETAAGFPRTFEEVGETLSAFDRLYFEPDGSFVWVSSAGDASWQVDGMLYDRAGRVVSLELKGACHAEALDRLIAALGATPDAVVYQLIHEGVVLDDEAFRRYAAKG